MAKRTRSASLREKEKEKERLLQEEAEAAENEIVNGEFCYVYSLFNF